MFRVLSKLSEIKFGELMQVYEEGNRNNARERYPGMDNNAGLHLVEQSFYSFLSDVFFKTKNALYAVWEENGKYVSALRLEPYEDGMLLEALETRPGYRRKGFAKRLMLAVMSAIPEKVYSHVNKENVASLAVHYACGFRKVSDTAVYIDGSDAPWCVTLCKEGERE